MKGFVKKALALGHQTLGILDRRYYRRELDCRWPPVFILGAPRSGTTLYSQLLLHSFEFAYWPNISNLFYMCPLTAATIGKNVYRDYSSVFTNRYGYEKGPFAPSEAGHIWNRWFPQEKRDGFNYTPAGYLSERDRRKIKQMVAHLERIFNAPFATKNLKMSVRLPVLAEIFPDALFVHVQRAPADAALSILLFRRKNNKSWWSVMPKEYPSLKHLSDLEQVAHQVYFIEQNIRNDLSLFPDDQKMKLSYREMCEHPQVILNKSYDFLTRKLGSIQRRNTNLPEAFVLSTPSPDKWIAEEEVKRVREIIDSLFK